MLLIQSDESDEYESSSLRGGRKIPPRPTPNGQEAAQMMYLEQHKPDKWSGGIIIREGDGERFTV
jgi:hypothetical protein